MQLVTSHVGGFDDVRVRAALFQLDEAHPSGCLEAFPAVEVEVKDKDHWISLDANTKRSHAEAGTGGLALVHATQQVTLTRCCGLTSAGDSPCCAFCVP